MAIINRALSDAWTRDPRLSHKARGLLHAILLSGAGPITIEGLARNSSDSGVAVRSGVRELVAAGYLTEVPRPGHLRPHLVVTDPDLGVGA